MKIERISLAISILFSSIIFIVYWKDIVELWSENYSRIVVVFMFSLYIISASLSFLMNKIVKSIKNNSKLN